MSERILNKLKNLLKNRKTCKHIAIENGDSADLHFYDGQCRMLEQLIRGEEVRENVN